MSSLALEQGRIRFDDLQGKHNYGPWTAYSQSKLANLLFAVELDRQARSRGLDLRSVAVHPGVAATNLQAAGPHLGRFGPPTRGRLFLLHLIGQSAARGAWPSLYAATAPDVVGGGFYGPDGPGHVRGHPTRVLPAPGALDEQVAPATVASIRKTHRHPRPVEQPTGRYRRLLLRIRVCDDPRARSTVLATDKTGTLIEGSMLVERLWLPIGEASRRSEPSSSGRFVRNGRPVDAERDHDVARLLGAGVLCSDATLLADGRATGDPTEVALLRAAAAVGLDEQVVEASQARVGEIPFDSRRKRMSTLHADGTGNWLVVCKGAPEQMLAEGVVLGTGKMLEAARARAHQWSADGLRVLAIATAAHNELPAVDEFEDGLTLLGLVGIFDPPRVAAHDTIGACRRAGVVPVLVTGDHAATATAIAGRVGIAEPPSNAVDLTGLTGPAVERSAGATVLARATPEHKLQLVETWQRRGDVVAMTGDGVNDGPALRRADIGVAMGRRGTEVARQPADVVLADDDLGTVVAAIEEGRRVYANIRRFLLYGISGGAAEILVMIFGPATGLPSRCSRHRSCGSTCSPTDWSAWHLAPNPLTPPGCRNRPGRQPRASTARAFGKESLPPRWPWPPPALRVRFGRPRTRRPPRPSCSSPWEPASSRSRWPSAPPGAASPATRGCSLPCSGPQPCWWPPSW